MFCYHKKACSDERYFFVVTEHDAFSPKWGEAVGIWENSKKELSYFEFDFYFNDYSVFCDTDKLFSVFEENSGTGWSVGMFCNFEELKKELENEKLMYKDITVELIEFVEKEF